MVFGGHTISMDGSKYTWEHTDERIKQLNLTRSKYVQQLIEKDIDGKKRDYRFIDIVSLCILFVIVLLLMMVML
jgi:hypothetical protein